MTTEQDVHREFMPGYTVMVCVYGGPDKWTSDIVLYIQKLGPVTHSVEIKPGKIIKRHTDQIYYSYYAKHPQRHD